MEHDNIVDRYTPLDVAEIIDGAQVVLDDGRYRVLSLRTSAAASWWGSGTRWCTTDPIWLQAYEQHGELICIQDRRRGSRWQFQFWRCELRNWRNRRADPLVFAQKHGAIIDALRPRIERDFRARFFFGLVADGETIEHSLNLRGVRLKSLPQGLKIRDDLDVSETGLKALPSGLNVGGNVYVSERPLPEMPSDCKVRGRRYVRSTRLLHLSETIGFR